MRIVPRDLVVMIDRLQVLFGRPNSISEGRSLAATITSEPLPVDLLHKLAELTRGLGNSPPEHTSGLPYIRERRSD
jgi:hypothetical protein